MSQITTTRPAANESDTGVLRLAAIDVGSNSLHMIVAQADADGGVTTLWRLKEMVGLGRMSFPSHHNSQEAMDRAIVTLRRFQQEAQRRQCEKVLAVATSAIREAGNGGDFIERARRELGMSIRVVSAREEARLICLGVRHAVDLKGGPHFIIDIGGGSVEFIVADNERAHLLESRKLGAARMTNQFIHTDPADPKELKALLAHYDKTLSPILEQVASHKPTRVLGTSGTLENLVAMSGGEPAASGNIFGGTLERGKFVKLLDDLLESRAKDRAQMRGLDDQRRDQVLAGALLVNEIFRRLDIKEIRLCKAALREGILVDYLSRHMPELEIRRQVPDPRRRSVLDLARRSDWFVQHREQVARLTLQLFDQLKGLHGMGRRERELIEYGALLHEIGWYIARDQHHKHSLYLILHGDLKGFTPEEIGIIGNIARYHRRKPPTTAHSAFEALSTECRRIVRVGAALLRIADGLDRSHSAIISTITARMGSRKVAFKLESRADAELELWAARKKSQYFTKLFGRSVTFEMKR